MDTKADVEIIQQINGSKATVQDLDSTRKMVERLGFEIENRPGFTDLEGHVAHTKGLLEDLTKELMLKASIKDLTAISHLSKIAKGETRADHHLQRLL